MPSRMQILNNLRGCEDLLRRVAIAPRAPASSCNHCHDRRGTSRKELPSHRKTSAHDGAKYGRDISIADGARPSHWNMRHM